MQLQNNKTKKAIKKIPTQVYLVATGAICLAGGIGATYHLTKASSSDYSTVGAAVILDGENDGTAVIRLNTAEARNYVAIQGTWSIHEVAEPETTQTTYLTLSGMKRGGSINLPFGANTGTTAWTPTPEDNIGMQVAAGGEVLSCVFLYDDEINGAIELMNKVINGEILESQN